MLSIGEFSRACFVTTKTLRHYDKIGLLRPRHIAENGYRYYGAEQLQTMLLISRLKGYGFSLPEIGMVLANADLLADMLREKEARMREQMEGMGFTLQRLRLDLDKAQRSESIMQTDIQVQAVELQPQTIFSIRRDIDMKDFGALIAETFAEAGRKGLAVAGPPMAFYHAEEYDEGHGDTEVALPVSQEGEGTRKTPGGLHAHTRLTGAYVREDFAAAYAGGARWAEENGYRIEGAPFDVYTRGGEGVAPEEYITDIYFPIVPR